MDNSNLDKRAQRQCVEDLVARPEQQPPVGTRVLLEYLYSECANAKSRSKWMPQSEAKYCNSSTLRGSKTIGGIYSERDNTTCAPP